VSGAFTKPAHFDPRKWNSTTGLGRGETWGNDPEAKNYGGVTRVGPNQVNAEDLGNDNPATAGSTYNKSQWRGKVGRKR
jgi:hypothetical protein